MSLDVVISARAGVIAGAGAVSRFVVISGLMLT